ncbi:MAG TPA: formate/nitrite transporter family protein [Rhodothermales bacterium]|nr:formate/nitrite transporter family protein [Rhodothermales bacterium]
MKKTPPKKILSSREFEDLDRKPLQDGNSHTGEEGLREVMDESRRGAPSSGEAVSDIFSTDEIFQRLLATADDEFHRSSRLLFLSGLAAGLSIGLTFLARSAMTGLLPEDATGLVGNLLYPIGFIFIILGRYQLFTENTLTPVTLVLTRLASLPRLLKMWGIVYAANMLGAVLTALLFSTTEIFDEPAAAAAYSFGEHAMDTPWTALFFKGMIAGWMVAGMVWLTHAVRDSIARFFIVYLIMYLVPSVGLFHCVIGACEIAYYIFEGGTTAWEGLFHFQLAVTLGNTIGGVLFVAIPNYFQTRDDRFREWERLTWKEWIWGVQPA